MSTQHGNNVAPDRIRSKVGWNLNHVEVLTNRASRSARRTAAGSLLGLSLDTAMIEKSLTEQVELICTLASQKVSFTYTLRGVNKVLWPLMSEVFKATKSGNGTTVSLSLEMAGAPDQAKLRKGTGPEKPVLIQETSVIIDKIEEVGLAGGIELGDFGVDGGGNFDVLSATAEWKDDTCFVYHSAQLTNDQLILVAALDLTGPSKLTYGFDPSVMKTAVVANGVRLFD